MGTGSGEPTHLVIVAMFRVEQVGISRLANCHQGVLCAQTHQIRECMVLNTNADDDADASDADDEDYVYRTENIFFHENCKNKTQCQLCKRLA